MLTIGTLIDHLELESKQLEHDSRESVLSFLNYDFELDVVFEHSIEGYVVQIKDGPAQPTSVSTNIQYLKCFNRDLPILTERIGSGKEVNIVTENLSCGKVDFCLTPVEK